MQISNAKYEGGKLILDTMDMKEAGRFVYDFKEGNYEINRKKEKRSLSANNYAWVLIDKLAARLDIPKTEIYRKAIREIGGVSDFVCLRNDSVSAFCRAWEKQGVGWQTERLDSKIEGCTNIMIYFGSSSYNTEQMNALLNNLKQECEQQGIEVKTPDEIAKMLSVWGEDTSSVNPAESETGGSRA